MKIKISQIELNQLTQSRVEINDEIVSDYKEAYLQCARFPDIKVYFDGAKYWLADGYHRYYAASKIGLREIDADVVEGKRRDAVLYSVGANAEHGLHRTHADKRKAVQTLLADQEWSKWSNNQIAKQCGVSHTLVNEVRRTLETASSVERNTDNECGMETRKFLTSNGKTAEMNTGKIGRKSKSNQPEGSSETEKAVAQPSVGVTQTSSIPEGMMLVSQEEYEEMVLNYQEVIDENTSMQEVFDATDMLSAAMLEISRFNAQMKNLQARINGLMNEKNEVVRLVKSRQRRCDQLEKQVKDLENRVKDYEKNLVPF